LAVSGKAGDKISCIFGAGYTSGTNSFRNWTIGNFGENNILIANGKYATIFGSGICASANAGNTFLDWTIGDFGKNNTLVAPDSAPSSVGEAGASIFGAAWNQKTSPAFSNWTIGNFYGGNVLVASSAHAKTGLAYSAIFGAGQGSSNGVFKNWTAEFRGSSTIAALGRTGSLGNIRLGALGGDRNGGANYYEGMRFYFNDLGEEDSEPNVVVAAVKLGQHWGSEAGNAVNSLGPDQGWNSVATYARAVALGPNFQLNVGRTRAMEENWQTHAAEHLTPGNENGGWETDESIRSGGYICKNGDKNSTRIGPGTLHLLGAVAAARASAQGTQADSTLRIDSGWTVNCYGPVQDVKIIDIIDGNLVLMHSSTDADNLAAVLKQLEDNIAYGSYQNPLIVNGENIRTNRAGGITFRNAGYPILGQLLIKNGEKLRFGASHIGEIHYWTSRLILNGNDAAISPQLTVNSGGKISLDLPGENELFDSDDFLNFPIVRMPNLTSAAAMPKLLGGITRGARIGQTDYYYTAENSILDRSATEYAAIENLKLLWSEVEGNFGLAIATVDSENAVAEESPEAPKYMPPEPGPTDYAKVLPMIF
jgi:hypothetical protein